MQTYSNKSLKEYNTFSIDVTARTFISAESLEDLRFVLQQNYAEELFLLGGGSNMLLTKDLDKTVVHIDLKGIEILSENDSGVLVKAMAGENWHQFVLYCIDKDFGGLENLSLIPGNVGTTPIQNIGAYGVEIKDRFHSCTALDLQTLEIREFLPEDCQFGYRDSVFKNSLKDKYIILSVTFALTKGNHVLNTSYGAIDTFLEEEGITSPTIRDVSNAVIKIRQSKLPDPRVLGNSGSFFKNPIVTRDKAMRLREKFPELPFYDISEEEVKIPAGWLIDRAGLKGYREGDAGVHAKQALVLVNYGAATGMDILNLSRKVQAEIKNHFGIDLEPEVNIF